MKNFWVIFFALTAVSAWAGTPRVVSLSPALTETAALLAGSEVLVGRSSACNYPEAVQRVPVVGRFGQLEVEKVLALKPDWVIANDLIQPSAAKALRRAGVAVEVRQCRNFEDYRWWVKRIGEKLNVPERADAEIARTRAAEAKLRALPKLSGKVLWVVYDAPLMVAGPGSLPDEALKLAGVENAAGEVNAEYFKCSEEWVIKVQPDAIIWALPGNPSPNHRFWGELKAVQGGKVITGLNDDLVLRPGPRWIEGLFLLRKALEEKLR